MVAARKRAWRYKKVTREKRNETKVETPSHMGFITKQSPTAAPHLWALSSIGPAWVMHPRRIASFRLKNATSSTGSEAIFRLMLVPSVAPEAVEEVDLVIENPDRDQMAGDRGDAVCFESVFDHPGGCVSGDCGDLGDGARSRSCAIVEFKGRLNAFRYGCQPDAECNVKRR